MQKKFLLCIFLNSLFPTPQNMGQIGLEVGLPWWLRFWERICLPCRRSRFDPWVGKIHWRRKWQPTPVFLPGESHGQRNLAGYSPWGCKELELTEQLSMHAQSYSNQNSVVLAQKQTYGSVQQDSEPRNKPTHLTSINV